MSWLLSNLMKLAINEVKCLTLWDVDKRLRRHSICNSNEIFDLFLIRDIMLFVVVYTTIRNGNT